MNAVAKSSLTLLLRLFLGGLFLYAAWDKILHPAAFSETVMNYKMLPRQLVHLFSLWLPWVELLVALLILAGIWARAAAILMSAMMGMFLVAILQAVLRGINIHCGCFTQGGQATDPVSFLTILRDAFFLVATLASAWIERDIPTWKLFSIGSKPN